MHEGKAAYPDVLAFKDYFDPAYDVSIVHPRELATAPDIGSAVCWHMMGFYPRRFGARLVIHDYRSLSVGRFRTAKDLLKRVFNATPDFRVFQNASIRSALGFPEHKRTFYLPMGVPDAFVKARAAAVAADCDFVYIGSLLNERRCELMIDSFVRRFGSSKIFRLYGARNPELEARYAGRENVQFCGLVAQSDLLLRLKAARVGVAYFPNHFPHVIQSPTKLMEYAALGMRVLANEQPQNRATASAFGIECWWGPAADMFRDVPDSLDWSDNRGLDPDPMRWTSVIERSGLPAAIAAALRGAEIGSRARAGQPEWVS